MKRYGPVLLLVTCVVAGIGFVAMGNSDLADSVRTFLQALRRAL